MIRLARATLGRLQKIFIAFLRDLLMVSTDTQITAAFVVIAVVLWYLTRQATENVVLSLVVLIGVGLVIPLAITGWRARTVRRSRSDR